MRRLTRSQIEAGGAAMPVTMKYHDRLLGQKLERVVNVPSDGPYPKLQMLVLDSGSCLSPRYDDEGNPGATEWQITDPEGYLTPRVRLRSLIGRAVTGFGYFHDPEDDLQMVIPYVEFAGTFLCCMTPHGGGVIQHNRPEEDTFDLFCQFTPKS